MKFSNKEIFIGGILIIIVLSLLVNFLLSNFTSAKFCGDGFCANAEMGLCKIDCIWCGDGSCNSNECEIGCSKDCSLFQCENRICEPEKGENCINTPNDCKCDGGYCNTEIAKCDYQSCGNNVCDAGENSVNCPNDCKSKYTKISADSNKDFPIIFVHGHSPTEIEGYNPTELEEFQDKLTEESYENKGYMLPSDYPPKLTEGIWSGKKVSVIMTYYANRYDKIGGVVGLEDNQHISVYAQRLRDVIEVIKHNTGKNKVIIIAHSMGGLVSREYIKNYGGINSVSKLITIGTPNHGTDAFTINTLCGILHPGPECEEMTSGSDFLIQLNTNDETPGEIKFLTIIGKNKKGTTCPNNEYWDNVICSSSVYLNGAENYYYEDFSESYSAISNSLHTIMVHPSKAPDVYNKIVEFLNSN